ncbi:26S proteasome non-ATPase regulatory subunit 5 [Euwallacea similis]|uniref:26S proteasome non-ATPase regulatory subunit 5 n=1 Tax=Euwallacea similis TaxID=1736056 RepID=UPI00344B8E60
MASDEKWFTSKLSNLSQEDLRISTLSELRDHLKALPHEETSRISNSLQLPVVFDCLNDSNSEQVDLACEVLSLCLSSLHLGESTTKYKTSLERALIHPYHTVKLMALKEIERSISNEEALCSLCEQSALINNIVLCLGDNNLGVAKKAADIIIALGNTVPGANKITSNEMLLQLERVMSINEVVRLRVYEIIITVSAESTYSFNTFKSAGLISKIIDELGSNDVLFKMNIIEILSQFVKSEHGYMFLDQIGVLNKIFSWINEDELTMQLCQPGILKFFGHVGHLKPRELLAKHPIVFDHLFSNIESSDLTLIGVSLDVIGYIGQTCQGKIALDSTGTKMEGIIRTISKLLPSLPTETRIRALNCIENLLCDSRLDIMQITEKWFRLLGAEPMEIITKYAKNPFSELRLAGLGVLNAISGQIWGQEAIKNTPGLVEFLLDRSIETIKDCKEAKYEIVKLLSQGQVFDRSTQERFEAFIKEGPFYVHAVTEVAIEGD